MIEAPALVYSKLLLRPEYSNQQRRSRLRMATFFQILPCTGARYRLRFTLRVSNCCPERKGLERSRHVGQCVHRYWTGRSHFSRGNNSVRYGSTEPRHPDPSFQAKLQMGGRLSIRRQNNTRLLPYALFWHGTFRSRRFSTPTDLRRRELGARRN
jgi:hypothetical protein